MSKEGLLFISQYCDYYGKLLTEHQRELIRCYYDNDMSLQEISELYGGSRQAVRESIKRAEAQLINYENAVGYVAKMQRINNTFKEFYAEEKIVSNGIKKCFEKVMTILEEGNERV